ncbi:MAG: hypothetical protein ACSLEW_06525 [Nocardioides sp.]
MSEPTTDPRVTEVVASVVASVDAIGSRPVAEHVAVFEAAHDTLRAALDPADD